MNEPARKHIEALAGDYLDELHSPRLSYKPAEAARLLGVDKRTVLRLIAKKRLHATKVNDRVYLIPRAALYDFLGVADPLVEQQAQAAR